MAAPHIVKGMVSVAGRSYRIVRIAAAQYQVVRILDDLPVGTFETHPRLSVSAEHLDTKLMVAIARSAMQLAKTSWMGPATRAEERRPTPPPKSQAVSEPPPSGVSH